MTVVASSGAGNGSPGPWEVSTIGQQVRRLRTGRTPRLTQQQLAERAGISLDVIQKLEQGRKRTARIPTLAKIAEALQVDLATLVSDPAATPAPATPEPKPALPEAAEPGSRHRRRNELIGRFRNPPNPSSEEPQADEPTRWLVAAGLADTAAGGPPVPPPGDERRVVLHWTGRKANALRIAMRMSVRDFSAKLGISQTVVSQWRHGGRLRYETHRILDTMLSLATDEDLLRFDLAQRESGET